MGGEGEQVPAVQMELARSHPKHFLTLTSSPFASLFLLFLPSLSSIPPPALSFPSGHLPLSAPGAFGTRKFNDSVGILRKCMGAHVVGAKGGVGGEWGSPLRRLLVICLTVTHPVGGKMKYSTRKQKCTGFVAGGFQSKRQEGIHVHVSIV